MEPPPDGDEEPTAGPDGLYTSSAALAQHGCRLQSQYHPRSRPSHPSAGPAQTRCPRRARQIPRSRPIRPLSGQRKLDWWLGYAALSSTGPALHRCPAMCGQHPRSERSRPARMAANAPKEAWICCTFLGLSSQSPPESMSPQVRIEPSRRDRGKGSRRRLNCDGFSPRLAGKHAHAAAPPGENPR